MSPAYTSLVPFASSLLVPTDLSPASHAALYEAARIARESACKVSILYVFDVGPWTLPPTVTNRESTMRRMVEEASGAAHSVLRALRERYFAGMGEVALHTVEHASAAQAICSSAEAFRADLIVMASHGRTSAVAQVGIGSVTEKVVRSASCRVLVVPSRDPQELNH